MNKRTKASKRAVSRRTGAREKSGEIDLLEPVHSLKDLQDIARKAWPVPIIGEDPPSVYDLVYCLTNVAVNRLRRIRELEDHIFHVCELRKRC